MSPLTVQRHPKDVVLSNFAREYSTMSCKQLKWVFCLPVRASVSTHTVIISEEVSQSWPAKLQEKVKESTC